MSVQYRPVTWTRNKLIYDLVLALGISAFVIVFLRYAPGWLESPRISGPQLRMRAFGTCAFILLTIVLAIGPLARLDRRFLPLLYNRRHFGVAIFFVALAHALTVLGWYQAFSPTDRYVALFVASSNIASWHAFPFEYLGMFALAVLFTLAATSHDFWLNFLGAPLWKAIHMSVYAAYAAVIAHVCLGLLQAEHSPWLLGLTAASVLLVCGLHLAAALKENGPAETETVASDDGHWVHAANIHELPDEGGVTVFLPTGEKAALFRYDGKVSALSNACAHQNGPLAEGRIIDGCVTCPWHGYQYRPEDGCSPAPFTEKVATYRLRREGDRLLIDANALPPGTPVPPIVLETGA
ncbi:ferric reductase-like transmembrane domain-containing protein [Nisaea acidiphila]|uniref:Ferric reductase-like transmembrane domain-containing protein n=1 Tax=Nisaea acidiphila TaxID=1862145 RepID=A0A9J7APM1_9PROT|nr:Rieske 2Fe-2S domain-containing protein [Nisaea acidiphila]UUX48545.1 ferric reductase-like transmembrane domain-containing protein [Nisaea acidiphila]